MIIIKLHNVNSLNRELLTDKNIQIENNFFITLENLAEEEQVANFFLNGKLFEKSTFFRMASQDKWFKVGIIGAGISVEILQEK